MNGRASLVSAVVDVQRIPYTWPAPPTAASVRETGAGTCAGKHALLREEIQRLGFRVQRLMVVGPLVPDIWPDLRPGGEHLLEVHECLTVETGWAGPLLVDVTWHPSAVEAGLPGTLGWDGGADMVCAVSPIAAYAVADEDFRVQKELMRARLYSTAQRSTRDAILAEMTNRVADL